MKNIKILAILFLISGAVFSQTVSEKLIVKLPADQDINYYSVKFDQATGSFAYEHTDTAAKVSYMVTAKGNSGNFAGINEYSAYFDKAGNVYYIAFNVQQDTEYTYFLLKNTEVIATFQYINDNWIERNGKLYFTAKENGKTFMALLDLSSGAITKQYAYDDILLVYYPDTATEGEPIGYPGFTSNGKLYYVASENSQKFVVIDGEEQKRYADIDPYFFGTDKNGSLYYVASSSGTVYDSQGNTFLVLGTTEYKKFDNVYGPVMFDNNNNPIYIGADNNTKSNTYPQQLMAGNDPIGIKYTGGVSYQQFTPSGKFAFVGTNNIDSAHSESFVVIDGKPGKKFENIFNLTFAPDGSPLYVAQIKGKQYIMKGDNKLTEGDPTILEYQLLPDGRLCYTSAIYGDYQKGIADKYYVNVGDDRMGPYEMLVTGDEGGSANLNIDKSGNYAFQVMKLVDKVNYIYSTKVISNKGMSGSYNIIDNLKLFKGKVFFTGSKTIDRKNYSSVSSCFSDFKEVTGQYEYTGNYKFDEASSTISFVGGKNGGLYYVELKF
jgi:hypothetical protein